MYKLYNDTENELYYEKDYKALPNLESLTCTELIELTENLYDAIENAYLYGSALLETALYNDIVTVNRYRTEEYLRSVSCGTIANIINNTRYTEIDKAITQTWDYYIKGEDDTVYFEMGIGLEGIENLVKDCYH